MITARPLIFKIHYSRKLCLTDVAQFSEQSVDADHHIVAHSGIMFPDQARIILLFGFDARKKIVAQDYRFFHHTDDLFAFFIGIEIKA